MTSKICAGGELLPYAAPQEKIVKEWMLRRTIEMIETVRSTPGADRVRLDQARSLAVATFRSLSQQDRAHIVQKAAYLMESQYVDGAVGKKMADLIIRHMRSGVYDQHASPLHFGDALELDLSRVCQDKHLGVFYSFSALASDHPFAQLKPLSAEAHQQMLHENFAAHQLANFGIHQVEMLHNDIGYLHLKGFSPLYPETKSAYNNAMETLSLAKVLILDLRKNKGGMVQSAAYLASFFTIDRQLFLQSEHSKQEAATTCYTESNIPAKVRWDTQKPVYILTDHQTSSASEAFVKFMKNSNKAIIIGRTTAGAAHSVREFYIDDHFKFIVPVGKIVGCWEKRGIAPHLKLSSDTDALERVLAIKPSLQPLIPQTTGPYAVGHVNYGTISIHRPSILAPGKIGVEILAPTQHLAGNKLYFPFFPEHPLQQVFTPAQLETLYTHAHTPLKPIPQKSFPLIIFSHGDYMYPMEYRLLFELIASHGFICVLLNHPLSSSWAAFTKQKPFTCSPNAAADLQSADIQKALDNISDPSTPLHKLLAPFAPTHEFILMGHDLGGAASMIVAHNDPRVTSCINLDGDIRVDAVGQMFMDGFAKPVLTLLSQRPHQQGSKRLEEQEKMHSEWDLLHRRSPHSTLHIINGIHSSDFSILPFLNSMVGAPSLDRGLKAHSVASRKILKFLTASN